MVEHLERMIDSLDERFEPPTDFVVPGQNKVSALLDVGRTVARRAERHSLAAAPPPSQACPYLNRLSDLLWTLARWQEGGIPRRQGCQVVRTTESNNRSDENNQGVMRWP